MKHGQVTPLGAIEVTPLVFIDVDIVLESFTDDDGAGAEAGDHHFKSQLASYPGLKALKLADAGPAGHPLYRVEGTLPVLANWLLNEYLGGDSLDLMDRLKDVKLAR